MPAREQNTNSNIFKDPVFFNQDEQDWEQSQKAYSCIQMSTGSKSANLERTLRMDKPNSTL